ncbi:hypothetical protein [Nocardia bhagyanarayanae]|uniref:Uncharacterized protein n=1 Tax=Nocardia bhagyanarayanae TaxID=1215925 RepID=A0A543FHZ7_9NOCA|nr:hypothetical protein [Nocardia bhagyanarayanae]TQM33480.1 hypothetical protein FB390_5210 [Nocardia bhagyanarayanae]
MSNPNVPVAQPTTQSQAIAPSARSSHGLLATAIVVAGLGGGMLAWHPWDENTVQEPPPKDPQRITIQHVGDQREAGGGPDSTRPVYCLTNETGGLYCIVMPNRYTIIDKPR